MGVYDGGLNGFGNQGIAVVGIGDCFSWGKDDWNEDEDGDDDERIGEEGRIHGWNEWCMVDCGLCLGLIVSVFNWSMNIGQQHLPGSYDRFWFIMVMVYGSSTLSVETVKLVTITALLTIRKMKTKLTEIHKQPLN